MQKTIVAGAFAIAVATTASFAAGEAKMKITSSAFQEGGDIPSKFSRDGGNVNPPLRVQGTPTNAKSLVLIVDDPGRAGRSFYALAGLEYRSQAN